MNKLNKYLVCFLLAAASLGCAPSPPAEKVYMVIETAVIDQEAYSQYIKQVPSIIEKYGGNYLVRGGRVTSITGNWHPERIIVIEFPGMQHLQECFQSPEYGRIALLRKQATVSKAIVVAGYDHSTT